MQQNLLFGLSIPHVSPPQQKPVKTIDYNNKNRSKFYLKTMDNLLSSRPPWGIYFAESFNTSKSNILPNITKSNVNRNATITGNISKESIRLLNGKSLYSISGPTTPNIVFPHGSIPNNFTICSITKYNGPNKNRILNANNANFLHGH